MAKWNGSTWSAYSIRQCSCVSGICYCSQWIRCICREDTFKGVGGIIADYVAKWDGVNWSALGSGMNNVVYGLTFVGTDLYATGDNLQLREELLQTG
jgi:hypothetical protein